VTLLGTQPIFSARNPKVVSSNRENSFHTFYSAGGDNPSEFFGFTEDKNHQPNGTRIAFWAHTRKEVDRYCGI